LCRLGYGYRELSELPMRKPEKEHCMFIVHAFLTECQERIGYLLWGRPERPPRVDMNNPKEKADTNCVGLEVNPQ